MTAPGARPAWQAKLTEAGTRTAAKARAMSPATRIAAVVGTLVIAVGGYVFVHWATAPTYAPLFSNLAAADASSVIDKLNTAGVPYQIGQNGSEILVPQQDVYAQRIALSADGLPSSPQTGYSLLDSEGVTTSEFRQRVDYQRALEGELANTIGAIDGVQQAQVHLAMPQRDVFDDGTDKTTASVLLTMKRGATMSSQQTTAIVNLVASSVPGLATNAVTVTDSTGAVLAAGGEAPGGTSGDGLVDAYRERVTAQLQAMLDKLVGPGKSVVSVNAQLDTTSSTTTSRSYTQDPNASPLAQSSTSEVYTGAGAGAAGGVAGVTAAATPAATTGTGNGNGSYTKTSNTQNNAVGTIDSTVQKPPGEVQRLGIAVVLDQSVPSSVSTGAVTQLVSSAAGIDSTRGDTVAVQRLAMDSSAASQAAAAGAQAQQDAAAAAARSNLITMIVASALAALVVLVGIVLFFRRRGRGDTGDGEFVLGPDDEVPPEPEPLVPTRPWSDQNLDVTRKELHNLAVEKPGDVAKVLRTWLAD